MPLRDSLVFARLLYPWSSLYRSLRVTMSSCLWWHVTQVIAAPTWIMCAVKQIYTLMILLKLSTVKYMSRKYGRVNHDDDAVASSRMTSLLSHERPDWPCIHHNTSVRSRGYRHRVLQFVTYKHEYLDPLQTRLPKRIKVFFDYIYRNFKLLPHFVFVLPFKNLSMYMHWEPKVILFRWNIERIEEKLLKCRWLLNKII